MRPLLLVASTRFDGDPSVDSWRSALHGVPTTGIDLVPLSVEDAEHLAESFYGTARSLVRECVQRAAGNPLFLEQLLLNAEEAGQENLPGTIQSLVHARLDRLDAADKQAVYAAAVLGQRFSLEALRHLVDAPAYDCAALVAHFLVRREGSGFLFCHALIRNGVYESALRTRRRLLHGRAAGWYEKDDPVLAAEHYERAEDRRAPAAYLAATDFEAQQFHYVHALALAERGLEIGADSDARGALLSARAALLLELSRVPESIDAYREAIDVVNTPADRCRALIGMASGMRVNDRVEEGIVALAEAQPLAEQEGLALELSRLHHLRGNLYFALGRMDECLAEHHASLTYAHTAGSVEAEATALGGLGDGYYLQGRMRSAHEQFVRCVALAREQGLAKLEVTVLHMIGWSAEYLLMARSAVEIGLQGVKLSARLSEPRAAMLSHGLVAALATRALGDLELAALHNARAREVAEKLGAARFVAQSFSNAAQMALLGGDKERARLLVREGLDGMGEAGRRHAGAMLFGLLARATDSASERSEALRDGEALLDAGTTSHNHLHFADSAIAALHEQGDWAGVERQCDRLERYCASEPLPWSEFVIARGRAFARLGRGERDDALRETLKRLRETAAHAELNTALRALDAAIAAGPWS